MDKCRSIACSFSSGTQWCSRGEGAKGVARSEFPRAADAQMALAAGRCLTALRACSRALMRFFATALL